MSRPKPEMIERLNRFLDATAEGQPIGAADRDLDPALVETVRRLRIRDDAPSPDRGFVNRLEAELIGAAAPAATDMPLGRQTTLNGRTTAPPHPPLRPPLRLPAARRRWALAQLATAALLVLTFGSLFLAFGGRGPAPFPDERNGVPVFRGGPARTGEQPGPGPRGTPTPRWQHGTSGRAVGSPTVVDGAVYVGGDDGILYALDAATGRERWRFHAEGAIGGASAAVAETVYVGDRAGTLSAITVATGKPLWQVRPGGSLYTAAPLVVGGTLYLTAGGGASAPAVVDGVVYVGSDASGSVSAKTLLALDAATGAERWRFRTNAGAGLDEHGVYAVDAATGVQRWHHQTRGYVRAVPAVADGVVYAGSQDGGFYALDAATGEERWTFRTGRAIYAAAAVAARTVFVGSTDGFLYALDAKSGSKRWHAATGAIRTSSPAVADGAVYVVADGALRALDASDGAERWRVAVGAVETSPAVVGGLVYVGATLPDGTAALLALGDG